MLTVLPPTITTTAAVCYWYTSHQLSLYLLIYLSSIKLMSSLPQEQFIHFDGIHIKKKSYCPCRVILKIKYLLWFLSPNLLWWVYFRGTIVKFKSFYCMRRITPSISWFFTQSTNKSSLEVICLASSFSVSPVVDELAIPRYIVGFWLSFSLECVAI